MNKNNPAQHIDICFRLAHNMLDDENAITKSMEESQSAFQNIRNGDSINIKTRITRQIVTSKAMSSLKGVYKDKIHTSTISSILEELNDVATLSERKEYCDVDPGKIEPGKYRVSKDVINKHIPEGGNIKSMAYKFSVEFEIEETDEP